MTGSPARACRTGPSPRSSRRCACGRRAPRPAAICAATTARIGAGMRAR
jgi:hypothetical protein